MTIKELREKYNLTQTALAKALSVSSNAISGIEAGRIKLSPKMTAKIKEVYGEEVDHAAFGTEKTAPAKKEAALKKAEKPAKKEAAEKAVVTAPTAAPAPEKKDTVEPAKAVTTEKPNEASVAPTAAPAPVKKAPVKKASTAKKAPTKKTVPAARRMPKAPATPIVILQSPFGGEITAEEILSKVGEAEKIYVRIDQNKAYWVKGEENGDVDLW